MAVAHSSGVAFESLKFAANGGGGGRSIAIDELAIATDWSDAVAHLSATAQAVPELSNGGLLTLMALCVYSLVKRPNGY